MNESLPTLGANQIALHGADHVILVDYANVPQDEIKPHQIFSTWARFIATAGHGSARALVRLYGGWFIEGTTSPERFRAHSEVTDHWPVVFTEGGVHHRLIPEFADQLIFTHGTRPAARVTHTVSDRRRAPRLRRTEVARQCQQADCTVKQVASWAASNRGCTTPACPHPFVATFGSNEQKQVDVHLATDLMALALHRAPVRTVTIVTNDIDVTPALLLSVAAAKISNAELSFALLRSHRTVSYADASLAELGVAICQMTNDTVPPLKTASSMEAK